MAATTRFRLHLVPPPSELFPGMEGRVDDLSPVLRTHGVPTMRTGPGSIAEQYNTKTTIGLTSVTSWPPTKPFGNRPAPAETLVRTGAYRSAWLGLGAGSRVIVEPHRLAVGVDHQLFPQARAFQFGGFWKADPARRYEKPGSRLHGRLMAHVALGMAYGAWIGEARLLEGWPIPARAISLNARLLDRIAAGVLAYLRTGVADPAPGRFDPSLGRAIAEGRAAA